MADTNQVEAVLANVVQKMADAGAKYGPEAINQAGEYLQVRAIGELVTSTLFIAAAGYAMRRLYQASKEFLYKSDLDQDVLGILAAIGAGLLGLVLVIVTCDTIFDQDVWIAAVSPRLALVQLAVKAVKP